MFSESLGSNCLLSGCKQNFFCSIWFFGVAYQYKPRLYLVKATRIHFSCQRCKWKLLLYWLNSHVRVSGSWTMKSMILKLWPTLLIPSPNCFHKEEKVVKTKPSCACWAIILAWKQVWQQYIVTMEKKAQRCFKMRCCGFTLGRTRPFTAWGMFGVLAILQCASSLFD